MKITMNAVSEDSIQIDAVVFRARGQAEKFVAQLRETVAVVWPRAGEDHDILKQLKK